MVRHFFLLLSAAAILTTGCRNPGQPTEINVPARDEEGSGSGDGSGADDDAAEPEPVPAAVRIRQRGVRIAEGRNAVVLVGEGEVELFESRLTAIVLDEDRNPIDVPVTWHSLDPEKVRVASDGTLTAVSLGPAFVTASAGDVIAEQIPVYVVTPGAMPVFEDEGSGDEAEESVAEGSGVQAPAGGDEVPPTTP
jgi:hypothetical protein